MNPTKDPRTVFSFIREPIPPRRFRFRFRNEVLMKWTAEFESAALLYSKTRCAIDMSRVASEWTSDQRPLNGPLAWLVAFTGRVHSVDFSAGRDHGHSSTPMNGLACPGVRLFISLSLSLSLALTHSAERCAEEGGWICNNYSEGDLLLFGWTSQWRSLLMNWIYAPMATGTKSSCLLRIYKNSLLPCSFFYAFKWLARIRFRPSSAVPLRTPSRRNRKKMQLERRRSAYWSRVVFIHTKYPPPPFLQKVPIGRRA